MTAQHQCSGVSDFATFWHRLLSDMIVKFGSTLQNHEQRPSVTTTGRGCKSNAILSFTSSHLLRGSDLNSRCGADRRRAIPELLESKVRLVDNVNVCYCLSFL